MNKVVSSAGWLALAATLFVLVDLARTGGSLPPIGESSSQRILDRNGEEIRHALSVNGERRYLFPLNEIPASIREAFIVSEDRRFYAHNGVDWRALGRGLLQSVRRVRMISGGSTITMQLVRIEWPHLRGHWHKPAQILQALWLETHHTKGELLTRYLNSVPFGNKVSGVGAACRYFFDKTCEQLSPAQVATIAVLPRNPSFLLSNRKALVLRRNALLRSLLSQREKPVLDQAIAEPVELARVALDFHAPHLTEKILAEKRAETELQTTIDLELQKSIEKLLSAHINEGASSGNMGAVLVLANDTAEVLAYAGGPDFFDSRHGMVDGIQALRSPGSALKPFIYELALQNNWNLYNIVPDIPMVFSTRRAIYEPNNHGGNFSGPRTLREALGNSKNLPALYLTSSLNPAQVVEHLRRIGFKSINKDSHHYGIGIALGNAEVTLWELAEAYATIARMGVRKPSRIYRDEIIKQQRVMPAETAYLIADALSDPQARQEEFGRFGPLEFDYKVAVKTGTSNDYRDHWTIGFTRDHTVAVWRGNADSTPMQRRISAARGAGPLFHDVMELLHRHEDPAWVNKPSGIATSRVCATSGQGPGASCKLTREEHHLRTQPPARKCEYHRTIVAPDCRGKTEMITYVQFPPEYEEWSKASRMPTLENQLAEKCGPGYRLHTKSLSSSGRNINAPAIVEPLDGTVYAIDPTIPAAHQQVRFALRGAITGSGLRVYMNDKPLDIQISDGEFYWQLARGRYKFHVRKTGNDSSEVSNEVNVLVR